METWIKEMVGMIKCLIPPVSGPIYETLKKKMRPASGRKGGR